MLQFWGKDLTRSAPSNGPLSKLMSEEIIPGNEGAGELSRLLRQYGCGPIQFAGTSDALYERHLIFDNVVDPATAHPRERFEAIARSVRDVLSQRWVHTERSYERENPKRVYYLSMEFLLGRSLANNLTNLLLDSFARQAAARKNLEWLELLEREPDAGLGNGGLGRLAACFLDSMATMELPAMSYGLRYEYGIFKQTIRDEPETRAALDLIFSDHFSRDERGVFEPLRDALLKHDRYMHLADLKSYLEADKRLLESYADPDAWARKAILNVAGSGKFSSDRTISEYASEIWNATACPVR